MTKKDIAELKRRLKKEGCTFTKLRGCYVDSQKNSILHIDETFLNLDEEEFFKYLEIAKKTLSGTIGNQLLELSFRPGEEGTEKQNFLLGLRDSRLKSDGLLERFYELVIEQYDYAGNYLILLFHDAYDVITKTSDNAKLDESEEVYEYILCAICPVELSKAALGYRKDENRIGPRIRDWIVMPPENGFLFPAFSSRSSDIHAICYYTKDTKDVRTGFIEDGLGCEPRRTAAQEKKAFRSILESVIAPQIEEAEDAILDIQQNLSDMVDEHKTVFETEPVLLTSTALREAIAESDLQLPEEVISKVEAACAAAFGEQLPLAENLFDAKTLAARAEAKRGQALQKEVLALREQLAAEDSSAGNTPAGEIIVKVSGEKVPEIKTEVINGRKCLIIPLEEDEQTIINGNAAEF